MYKRAEQVRGGTDEKCSQLFHAHAKDAGVVHVAVGLLGASAGVVELKVCGQGRGGIAQVRAQQIRHL